MDTHCICSEEGTTGIYFLQDGSERTKNGEAVIFIFGRIKIYERGYIYFPILCPVVKIEVLVKKVQGLFFVDTVIEGCLLKKTGNENIFLPGPVVK